MVIVLDENVSLALASALRQAGHEVIAIAETTERGMTNHELDEYKGRLVTLWPGEARIRC